MLVIASKIGGRSIIGVVAVRDRQVSIVSQTLAGEAAKEQFVRFVILVVMLVSIRGARLYWRSDGDSGVRGRLEWRGRLGSLTELIG